MPKRVKQLARVDETTGKLVPMSLIEWAQRFNETHRLHPAKKGN